MLACHNNKLIKLYYPFDIAPDNYPETLEEIVFSDIFNQKINNLPKNLKYLTFGNNFNQKINYLIQ